MTASVLWLSLLLSLFYSYESFFAPALADGFPKSLSDSKSSQVSRNLLSILGDLNNAEVWMVSTRPFNSKSFSPCTNPLVTVPSAPIAIGITVTFMIHIFFNSLARSRYLSVFSPFLSFTLWSFGTAKFTIRLVLFFFCCWLSQDLFV